MHHDVGTWTVGTHGDRRGSLIDASHLARQPDGATLQKKGLIRKSSDEIAGTKVSMMGDEG
jgi:hypothetical protein